MKIRAINEATQLKRQETILTVFNEAISTLEITRVDIQQSEPTLRVSWIKTETPKGTIKTIWLLGEGTKEDESC